MPEFVPPQPGTLIHHHITQDVYEVLDPPGRFRVVQWGNPIRGLAFEASRIFTNVPFYEQYVSNPETTLVSIVDCPVKIRKLGVLT